jgi:DNA-binding LytR/AlgR family response regulator
LRIEIKAKEQQVKILWRQFLDRFLDLSQIRRIRKLRRAFLMIELPDAPGDQVYKTAKQIDPDLNVIVITGYPDSEILDRILQSGHGSEEATEG